MTLDFGKFDFESNKIFSALNENEMALLNAKTQPLSFKKGSLIFYEGGTPTGAFLLKHGRAKIFKTGIAGKEQIFYIYRGGDLLGYHGLLCDELFEESCQALENCEMDFISKQNFYKLLYEVPRLKLLLIKNMSHEFGVLVNTITVLAQKPLRERLALHLVLLQKRYEDDDNLDGVIQLPREDLANIVGTARESLGRLLKEFKEEGLIDVQKRDIALTDMETLMRLATAD